MKFILLLVLTVAMGFGASPADADEFPNKTIRMVLPYLPGGPTDTVARAVSQEMSKILNTPIIVENRPGADSTIGAANVARSPADGYSLLFGTSALAINSLTYQNLSFNAQKDLTAIGMVGTQYLVLVINPTMKFDNLSAFVRKVRENPQAYTYGTSGSTVTLVTELFHHHAGISGGTRVPYNGNAPLQNAFYSGVLNYAFVSLESSIGGINAGKMIPLAVTAPERVSALPDVPTTTEAGFPNTDAGVWYIIEAPGKTPTPIIARLNSALNQALESKEVKELTDKLAGFVLTNKTNAQDANQFLQSEIVRWAPIVKTTGLATN